MRPCGRLVGKKQTKKSHNLSSRAAVLRQNLRENAPIGGTGRTSASPRQISHLSVQHVAPSLWGENSIFGPLNRPAGNKRHLIRHTWSFGFAELMTAWAALMARCSRSSVSIDCDSSIIITKSLGVDTAKLYHGLHECNTDYTWNTRMNDNFILRYMVLCNFGVAHQHSTTIAIPNPSVRRSVTRW